MLAGATTGLRMMLGRKGAGKREGVQDVVVYGRALPDHDLVLRFEMWGSWSVSRVKALESRADARMLAGSCPALCVPWCPHISCVP